MVRSLASDRAGQTFSWLLFDRDWRWVLTRFELWLAKDDAAALEAVPAVGTAQPEQAQATVTGVR